MSKLGKIIKYRKSDRDAIIILILVVVSSVVLIPLLADKDITENETKENSYGAARHKGSPSYYSVPEAEENVRLFPFDPNTADSTQLLALGLKPWQVRSIYRYRAKGGHFYKPSDFARLYGLTLRKYRQLEPYIRIAEEPMARDYVKDEPVSRPEKAVATVERHYDNPKLSPGMTIDINAADTTTLKTVPGIGSYFARRVVELRQRKGAFASPEELLSIRNFPETALTYMTASQDFPKLRINSMTLKELHSHPLLNYAQARDIINLRRTAGRIGSLQDMAFLPSLSEESLKRLAPYIIYE